MGEERGICSDSVKNEAEKKTVGEGKSPHGQLEKSFLQHYTSLNRRLSRGD